MDGHPACLLGWEGGAGVVAVRVALAADPAEMHWSPTHKSPLGLCLTLMVT